MNKEDLDWKTRNKYPHNMSVRNWSYWRYKISEYFYNKKIKRQSRKSFTNMGFRHRLIEKYAKDNQGVKK